MSFNSSVTLLKLKFWFRKHLFM